MEALIGLLVSFLPQQVAILKYLKYVPDAVSTVKELAAWIQRVIKVLKSPEVPLTAQQEAILDAAIEAMKDDPYHSDPEFDTDKPKGA